DQRFIADFGVAAAVEAELFGLADAAGDEAAPHVGKGRRPVMALGLLDGSEHVERLAHDMDDLGLRPAFDDAVKMINIAGCLLAPTRLALGPGEFTHQAVEKIVDAGAGVDDAR